PRRAAFFPYTPPFRSRAGPQRPAQALTGAAAGMSKGPSMPDGDAPPPRPRWTAATWLAAAGLAAVAATALPVAAFLRAPGGLAPDRKSTRLNSSHVKS